MSNTVQRSSSSAPSRSKPASSKPASSKPASSKPASSKPAASKPAAARPASTSPAAAKPQSAKSTDAAKPASTATSANATQSKAPAAPKDTLAPSTRDTGSTAQSQQSAQSVVRGLNDNFRAPAAPAGTSPGAQPSSPAPAGPPTGSTPAAGPAQPAGPAAVSPGGETAATRAATPAAETPSAIPAATAPATTPAVTPTAETPAAPRADRTPDGRPVAPPGEAVTPEAKAAQQRLEGTSAFTPRAEFNRLADDRDRAVQSALPHQYSEQQVQQRRDAGVPPELENHYAGPPAAPFTGDLARNPDGTVRTGTIQNENWGDRHQYVTQNALPAGLTREQAVEAFRRYNAPTHATTLGSDGNNPGPPFSQGERPTHGYVDPGIFGRGVAGPLATPVLSAGSALLNGVNPLKAGGHVDLRHGETAAGPNGEPGRAWAINTTRQGEHPLAGHITRTLVEDNGRYYIRTEGVGTGNNPGDAWSSQPHATNSTVGPTSFNNLDGLAGDWARRRFLEPSPSTSIGAP